MSKNKEKKILIVEDDDDLRDSLKSLLESEGFRVDAIANGENVFNIAADFKPDLIFLDMIMPIKDGRTVLKEFGQTKITPKICVMTGCYVDAAKEYFEKMTNQEISAFIRKPADLIRLAQVAKELTQPECA